MRREPLGEGVRQREMEGEGERSKASRVPKIHIVKKLGIRKRVQVFRIFILCQWIILTTSHTVDFRCQFPFLRRTDNGLWRS